MIRTVDILDEVIEFCITDRFKERGNGIGLAVCEEIVSRHNGKLTIYNAEGGGLLVTVTLPM